MNPQALMMGVTMMAATRDGSVFTHGQVAGWLRDAGLEAIRLIEPIGFQDVLVAHRPEPRPDTPVDPRDEGSPR